MRPPLMMYSPLGAYVTFKLRARERRLAFVVGVAVGLAAASVAFLLGANA